MGYLCKPLTLNLCLKHGFLILNETGCRICIQETDPHPRVGRKRQGCVLDECHRCINYDACRTIYTQDMWSDDGCPHYQLKTGST